MITEGKERRGGLLPRPTSPKPKIKPTGQGITIFGCPVEIDSDIPDNEIWLRSGNQIVKMKVAK